MENDQYEQYIEMPEKFHSFSTGTLFDRCIECDKYLLDADTEYYIEKAIKRYDGFSAQDVIFEYAICIDCVERIRKEMSEESLKKIEDFFVHNMDMERRMNLVNTNPGNPDVWTSECLIKGTKVNQLREFQLYAHCKGEKLDMRESPYLLGNEALDEIQHLLSQKTLDELNGFRDRNFGPPPELEETLPYRRVLLV
ncbi:hypothetical protein FNH22_17130 [Fulvivirga sp. M361]|uniref:hypothetical protein n=1 Tax=Fulvivirga sp. M361 TaxID=2594266 RepID=UPI001179A722|nr:hypothetical protein [Fulvivirga sp. M361]TRX56102.1 hypothetical protein FNH22_17130 [Fulvivirga sp. M361]